MPIKIGPRYVSTADQSPASCQKGRAPGRLNRIALLMRQHAAIAVCRTPALRDGVPIGAIPPGFTHGLLSCFPSGKP